MYSLAFGGARLTRGSWGTRPRRHRGGRQPAQAVVEFGIIALLFTLLMFAVVDFGLLLNTWLSVSSGSRDIARSAAVGKQFPFLQQAAQQLNVPAVSSVGFSGACCSTTSAVEVRVEYFNGGANDPPGSPCKTDPLSPGCQVPQSALDSNYPWLDLTPGQTGGCTTHGSCAHPVPDDLVRVTVIAHGAQVITPLVRPFFGCTNGNNPNCHVALTSTTAMRFEGQEF